MEVQVRQKQEKITDMKARMRDIYLAVSWREVSRTYFDKSVSWFQQKMYGIDGNGGVGGFTPDEADKLYCALNDLADRMAHPTMSVASTNQISEKYDRIPQKILTFAV